LISYYFWCQEKKKPKSTDAKKIMCRQNSSPTDLKKQNRYNFADDTGTDLKGDGSHGSHCAGTIAADNDNGVGVSGIAGGKGGDAGASLMIGVVFGNTNTDGFAEALVYGADNGAHITSNRFIVKYISLSSKMCDSAFWGV
jgi:subtilisin family serine protease